MIEDHSLDTSKSEIMRGHNMKSQNENTTQQLLDWAGEAHAYPQDSMLHTLFEAQVVRSPDVTAIVLGSQRLSYYELNACANRVAHYLINQGVERDELVALYLPRSIDLIVGILGILKAGAAYVPLDTNYPEVRLRYMLDDCNVAQVLMQQASQLKPLMKDQHQVLYVDDKETLSEYSVTNPSVETLSARNLAYVIYTSGTTGKPKGVMVEHRSVAIHCLALKDKFALQHTDVCLQFSSFSFDPSVEQLFIPLFTGCTVHIIKDPKVGVDVISEYLINNQITVAELPPPFMDLLLKAGLLKNHSCLKKLIVGSESLPAPLLENWHKSNTSEYIFNAYGQTESALTATLHKHRRNDPLPEHPQIIGEPIPGHTVYVLSPTEELQPIGVSGELYVGGDCLARGYLNREKLTANCFIKDPFSNTPEARLYRTGDRVCWLPSGVLAFVGRMDDQVKVRGFRIEPSEIEVVITKYQGISEALVVLSGNESHKHLVAYVTHDEKADIDELPDISLLDSYLREQMPEYMVPSAFVWIDTWPLTDNGKIDHRALPPAKLMHRETYIAPSTEMEDKIVGTWAEVLEIPKTDIGINDSFFDIGGNSLLVVKLQYLLQENYSVDIKLSDLYEYDSVAEQQVYLKDNALESSNEYLFIKKINEKEKEEVSKYLSYTQALFWASKLDEEGDDDLDTLNISTSIIINESLDIDKLQKSLNILVEQYEILRSSISNKSISRNIQDNVLVTMNCINCYDNASSPSFEDAIEAVRQDFERNFDTKIVPLMRANLVQKGPDKHILFLTFPHVVIDGRGLDIFSRELRDTYFSEMTAKKEARNQDFTFSDFIYWERNIIEKTLENNRTFWEKSINGYGFPRFPERYLLESPSAIEGEISIDVSDTKKLLKLAFDNKASTHVVLMSIISLSIYAISGENKFTIISIYENRGTTHMQKLIAPLLSFIPVSHNIIDDTIFEELVSVTKINHAKGIDCRHVPIALLQALCTKQRWNNELKINAMISKSIGKVLDFMYRKAGLYKGFFVDLLMCEQTRWLWPWPKAKKITLFPSVYINDFFDFNEADSNNKDTWLIGQEHNIEDPFSDLAGLSFDEKDEEDQMTIELYGSADVGMHIKIKSMCLSEDGNNQLTHVIKHTISEVLNDRRVSARKIKLSL